MRRDAPSLITASSYRQKIQDTMDKLHIAPSKDLAAMCVSYLDCRQLYKVVFSDQVKNLSVEYEFVALVDSKYELLDLFIAYFKLYLYNIEEDKFFELMQGIELVSDTKFISSEPMILYGIKYQVPRSNQKIVVPNSYWKHFRDGYRRGLDISSVRLNKIPNSMLTKCPSREFYIALVGGVVPSHWSVETGQTFLMYRHDVWSYMDITLGLCFSDDEYFSDDEEDLY